MNYAAIKRRDIANGIGVRVSLFVSGCRNACPECFNRETWAFDYGRPFDEEARSLIFGELSLPYVDGLSVLGGEPFEPENQRALLPFIKEVRKRLPEKTVWIYSGFTFEELTTDGSHPHCEVTNELLGLIDILVDGRFVEEEKDISLKFRGSRNQRILDATKSLRTGKAVTADI